MDGIPALDLWNLVVEVFHSSPNQLNNTKDQVRGNLSRNTTSNKLTQHDNFDLSDVDSVPSNAKFSRFGAMLYNFEDNEAVIKMIFKGRSPTMRHVSRTHRVALDWLFDRVNLDPRFKSSMSTPNTNFADILTKGNFTRDEWNNLLHLFNNSHFSLLCCSQNFSLTSCTKSMAKRMQEQEGEDRIVAMSKPTTMNLAFNVSTCSSTVQNLVASKSPEILKAPCRTEWSSTGKPDAKEYNQDAASSFQGWQKDAVQDAGTRKLVATEEDQEHLLLFFEDSVSTRKLVASGNSEVEGSDKIWPHNLHVSTNYVLHMEKVFSIVRRRYGLSPIDQMKNLDVKTAIWCIFMSVTLQAAVQLGTDYTENLRFSKNQPKKSLRQLFQVTQRLITDQTEITGLTTIDWQQRMWRETTLLTDRVVQLATAKTYVFSDSVLCLGGISTEPVRAWESKIQWFLKTRYLNDLDRIDGEQMEFEWKIPRVYYIGNSRRGSKYDDWIKVWTWTIQRKDHLHVNEKWHWLGKTMKHRRLYFERSQCYWVCSKIHARTLVVSGAWIGEEMARNACLQTWWRMGENCWRHDAQLCRKRTSHFPVLPAHEKEKTWKGEGVKSIHFNGSDDAIFEQLFPSISSVSTEQ